MLKKIPFRQSTWWLIIITIHATVGSCGGCRQIKAPIPLRKSSTNMITTPTTSTDKVSSKLDGSTESLHSEGSDSSGFSSGSSLSRSSSSSSSSEHSSGSFSSRSSSIGSSSGFSSGFSDTPPPPTPFAGLPNVGNTCYMNAVLQVIAAVYSDKACGDVKKLIDDINAGSRPLTCERVGQFIGSLPELEKKLRNLRQQQDPDELIDRMIEFRYLDLQPIEIKYVDASYTQLVSKFLYKLPIMMLSNESNLSSIIACFRGIDLQKHLESVMNTHAGDPISIDLGSGKDLVNTTVINLPDKFYIKLSRSRSAIKETKDVSETLNIKIPPYPNQQDSASYDLNAFIVHIGGRIESGHYIAYVKRAGKWYQVNDSIITEVDESDAGQASGQAYLLFYKKR